MAIPMKGIGRMIMLMDMVYISIKEESNMKDIGNGINSMDRALKFGQMDHHTKEIMSKVKEMEEVY